MKITNEELKKYYWGAYRFSETEDGYLTAYQYSKPQIDYFKRTADFWYERCTASSAKTIEFITEATEISFQYKIVWKGSEDTFELWIDGLAAEILYVKDMEDEGTITFKMPAGKKQVVIYLVCDATALIREFETNGALLPVEKGSKVLWLGDSITQGYGPLRSAYTYVSVANRILNYDIINQGIGGYVYDKHSLQKMDGYTPDKIIVSLGTNQFRSETMKDVEAYYETLNEVYGSKIPVLCISPIWRGDCPNEREVFDCFCDKVKEIASAYANTIVIDGRTLVPHLPEYFLDMLHPNCLGAEAYGINLARAIRKIGFCEPM